MNLQHLFTIAALITTVGACENPDRVRYAYLAVPESTHFEPTHNAQCRAVENGRELQHDLECTFTGPYFGLHIVPGSWCERRASAPTPSARGMRTPGGSYVRFGAHTFVQPFSGGGDNPCRNGGWQIYTDT